MKPIWSGAISFGLIYIPVRLYNASESQDLDLDMVRRGDHCRIRYARVCRETGEEVPWEDIEKAYEYKKGEYVVLTDEDFKRASVRKRQTIDIMTFVNAAEIDQKYLEKPYYVEPAKEATKAYALLCQALTQSGKVGIARFVMRTRERIALVKAEKDVIILDQMRYASEVRPPGKLDLPEGEHVSSRELDMAVKLINQLTEPWRPEQYHDTYVEDLKRIVAEKVAGKTPEPVKEEPVPVDVTDLFAKLTASLNKAKSEGPAAFTPPEQQPHGNGHGGNGHAGNGHKHRAS